MRNSQPAVDRLNVEDWALCGGDSAKRGVVAIEPRSTKTDFYTTLSRPSCGSSYSLTEEGIDHHLLPACSEPGTPALLSALDCTCYSSSVFPHKRQVIGISLCHKISGIVRSRSYRVPSARSGTPGYRSELLIWQG
jgi:hypothetical protein